MDPVATVYLPLWNAAGIAWLALESLCHQKEAPPWELVVIEEDDLVQDGGGCLGEDGVMHYRDKLHDAGCVDIKYAAITDRIPLSFKHRMAGIYMAGTSNVTVLQAADCYSDPLRIRRQLSIIEGGFDWSHSLSKVFYDIPTRLTVQYMHDLNRHMALDMAMRSDLWRSLPAEEVWSGVDKWLFRSMRKAKGSDLLIHGEYGEALAKGVDTHGANTISTTRYMMMSEGGEVFTDTDLRLHDVVPRDIADKLWGMAAGRHLMAKAGRDLVPVFIPPYGDDTPR